MIGLSVPRTARSRAFVPIGLGIAAGCFNAVRLQTGAPDATNHDLAAQALLGFWIVMGSGASVGSLMALALGTAGRRWAPRRAAAMAMIGMVPVTAAICAAMQAGLAEHHIRAALAGPICSIAGLPPGHPPPPGAPAAGALVEGRAVPGFLAFAAPSLFAILAAAALHLRRADVRPT